METDNREMRGRLKTVETMIVKLIRLEYASKSTKESKRVLKYQRKQGTNIFA